MENKFNTPEEDFVPYYHPDTGAVEMMPWFEEGRRQTNNNDHRKNHLSMVIGFLENKIKDIYSDPYPHITNSNCTTIIYERNLARLKEFRKHLYNSEVACYDSVKDIIGEEVDFVV